MVRKIAIIPARFSSSRFPGKPMALVDGKPMIIRVWENVCRIQDLYMVVVATDDRLIQKAVQDVGGEAVLTRNDHLTGTDRVAEVASWFGPRDIILNVQGDLPFANPRVCQDMITVMEFRPEIDIITPAIELESEDETLLNPNTIKTVFSRDGRALYFSRCPIPHKSRVWYRHIGIYGFRNETLQRLVKLPDSDLERAENLEQLRWLDSGESIHVMKTIWDCGPDINVPEDLERLNKVGHVE